jgi:protein subunit release factor B
MLQQTVNDFSSRVMIDHLPKGIYLLQVDTEKGRATQKVLIH